MADIQNYCCIFACCFGGYFVYTMDYSEKLVVNGLRKGDTEAFKYLYDTHYQVLCHFASRYLRDDYLAESVVGDVMFHLWENHERIEVEVSLRSYLIRCVRNSCLDHLRKNREKYEIATEAIPPSSDETMVTGNGEQPLGQLLDKELAEKLDEAIAALPLKCRTVFELLCRQEACRDSPRTGHIGQHGEVSHQARPADAQRAAGALHRDGTLAPEHTVINHNIKQETT